MPGRVYRRWQHAGAGRGVPGAQAAHDPQHVHRQPGRGRPPRRAPHDPDVRAVLPADPGRRARQTPVSGAHGHGAVLLRGLAAQPPAHGRRPLPGRHLPAPLQRPHDPTAVQAGAGVSLGVHRPPQLRSARVVEQVDGGQNVRSLRGDGPRAHLHLGALPHLELSDVHDAAVPEDLLHRALAPQADTGDLHVHRRSVPEARKGVQVGQAHVVDLAALRVVLAALHRLQRAQVLQVTVVGRRGGGEEFRALSQLEQLHGQSNCVRVFEKRLQESVPQNVVSTVLLQQSA